LLFNRQIVILPELIVSNRNEVYSHCYCV
jgi:hypothetical protein